MAVNFLLKFEGGGIKGSSAVEGYSDHIDLESFKFGGDQSGTFGQGGGGGGGKFTAHDFEFTATTNKSTPKTFEACAKGEHLKSATLICRKAGGNSAVEYLKVTMSDVIITSHTTEFTPPSNGATGNEITKDKVSMNFNKISVEYKEQTATGSPGASVEGGYDIAKGKSGK